MKGWVDLKGAMQKGDGLVGSPKRDLDAGEVGVKQRIVRLATNKGAITCRAASSSFPWA